MSSYITIIFLLLAGLLLKKSKLLPLNFHEGINKLIVYFFVPIITLLYLPEIKIEWVHIWLIITPWLIYLGAVIFFVVIRKFKKIPNNTLAVLIMTSGIGSISFVGFPIFELFYGSQGLAYGVILSLGGTFIVCNSIGIITGLYFKKEKFETKKTIKKIFYFPPFIALLISLVLMGFDYQHPLIIKQILEKIASPFSVLSLLAIGYQASLHSFSKIKYYFILGQAYKLIIAPLLIFAMFYYTSNELSVIAKISILGAGIGSMNTIAIIATELKLHPKLAMLMPSLGIPISIITVLIIQILIN